MGSLLGFERLRDEGTTPAVRIGRLPQPLGQRAEGDSGRGMRKAVTTGSCSRTARRPPGRTARSRASRFRAQEPARHQTNAVRGLLRLFGTAGHGSRAAAAGGRGPAPQQLDQAVGVGERRHLGVVTTITSSAAGRAASPVATIPKPCRSRGCRSGGREQYVLGTRYQQHINNCRRNQAHGGTAGPARRGDEAGGRAGDEVFRGRRGPAAGGGGGRSAAAEARLVAVRADRDDA